jgi:hypothetical protein
VSDGYVACADDSLLRVGMVLSSVRMHILWSQNIWYLSGPSEYGPEDQIQRSDYITSSN